METRGSIKDIQLDWKSRKTRVTVEVAAAPEEVEKMMDKDLTIIIKQYRQKRSLDANAYYWQLITKLSPVVRTSAPALHNQMLRRYGQPFILDGKLVYLVIPDTDEAAEKAMEAETFHIKPTSEVKTGADGIRYRTYTMLRGSSTYDTKEMTDLINGLVDECKEAGVETLTPEELERMMELYDKKHRAG